MPNNTFDNTALINTFDRKIFSIGVDMEGYYVKLSCYGDTVITFKNELEGTATFNLAFNETDVSNYVQSKEYSESQDDEAFYLEEEIVYDFLLTTNHTDIQALADDILDKYLKSNKFEMSQEKALEIIYDFEDSD